MTATSHVSIAGVTVSSLVLHVPPVGPWWADAVLVDGSEVSGSVEIAIGDSLTLRGTVIPARAGLFAEQRSTRIVAGGGGWASMLDARAYHNDSGVSARTVAADAATAAGETLGAFSPAFPIVGIDYVRTSGAAAVALEAAIGDVAWWVGYDGVTVVGARSTSTPTPESYQVIEFDPIHRVATLGVDDLASITIGSTLAAEERLPDAQTVRELRIEVSGESATVIAWCGDLDTQRGRLPRVLEAAIEHVTKKRLFGSWRYRVIRMNTDRVELQAVSPGVPDIGPISMAPGVAGAHASLAPGSIVLVEFVEGLRTLPRITHFAGKDGDGFTPVSVLFDASGASASIKLGANASETPAWASKVLAELNKIVTTLGTGSNSGGPVVFATPYIAPVSAAALGAAKTVCE